MYYVIELKEFSEEERKTRVWKAWDQLDQAERLVFNKLLTGSWRMGVSQKLMTRALAKHSGLDENVLSHRLMGNWTPDTTSYRDLVEAENEADRISRPYPFYLAYALEEELNDLGKPEDWFAEYKWDGIRGQLIVRKGELFVWSRGEELVTDKFPEFNPLTERLPDGTVIDGEITAYNEQPLGFNVLQTRIGRKTVSKQILKKAPVVLIAYDLLEYEGKDLREQPMEKRRAQLEQLVKRANSPVLLLSEIISFSSWKPLQSLRDDAREKFAEGLMLKHKQSTYKVGRKKGDWWKWKVDPLTIDAVMIYAMRGHGRRANLYTDYTFAVWDGEELVPFTKAYSGLTDKEFRQIDHFVKRNTIERFGPVRSVKPELVFEIAFEGIAASKRHKSGVALRFPRMLRWRQDKKAKEANTLAELKQLLEVYGN